MDIQMAFQAGVVVGVIGGLFIAVAIVCSFAVIDAIVKRQQKQQTIEELRRAVNEQAQRIASIA